ncbi:MAG: DUF1501 domain-containing protein, partial [Planctomycetia bacterium]|nr:DUF1501 domain-containing protein [Planctomycetia bacterium]
DCFTPDSETGRANLTLRNITVARLEDRLKLQSSFDTIRRDLDTRGSIQAMDAYAQRAVQFVTSREFAQALDISREPDRVRSRYGIGIGPTKTLGLQNARFLLARRLIESGARCVNLTWEEGGARRWDTHENNFKALRDELLPPFDIGLSAFLDDLEVRGMIDDVLVLVWGEFGRTPRINNKAGRDHYAPAGSALLFGGGLKVGQVIGSTNRYGERPQDRPIQFQQVFATLYRHLGIDPAQATLLDPNNRPQYLLEHTDVIRELT